MITQNVKTEVSLSSMLVELGNGDVAVNVANLNDDKVVITLSNMVEKQEVGSEVDVKHLGVAPVVIVIDNVESANTLKKAAQQAVKRLKAIEEEAKAKALPRFTVPFKNIFVTGAFKCSNPAPKKIMDCHTHYINTGELDREIEVTKNIVVKDGYVAYIVAQFVGINELKVLAPDGIETRVGNEVVRFMTDEIEVNYHLIQGTQDIPGSAFYLTIKHGDQVQNLPAAENTDAVEYLKKINDVFRANFVISSCSTLNVGLMEKMKEANLQFTVAQE